MKKLVVAVAAVALALGAQASSSRWNINYAGTDYRDTGANAMLFDSNSKSTVLGILGDFGAEGKTLADLKALAIESDDGVVGVSTPVGFMRGATAFASVNAINVSASQDVFAILFEDDIKIGTAYQVATAKSLDGYTVEPPAPPESTLVFIATDFTSSGVIQGGTPVPPVVPEPTSAMLLILGVAGLALRRRRA